MSERCIPTHFVLAIVAAEACGWCERKSSLISLLYGMALTLRFVDFVCLRICMSPNNEVRRKNFFHLTFLNIFFVWGGTHARQLLANIEMEDTSENIGKQLQRK